MTLMELTGHEAGIVLYSDGNIVVTNWGSYDDDQVPRVMEPLGVIGFPTDGALDNVPKSETIDDIRTILPGTVWMDGDEIDTDMTILADENNDITALYLKINDYVDPDEPTSAEVYTLSDGTKIIAPHSWQ